MKPGRKFFLTALIFFVVMGISGSFIALIRENQQAALRTAVSEIGNVYAHNIETELDRSLSATYALASILRQEGQIQNFDSLAAEMMETIGGITNLQLAPNAVIQQIYPLAGNEAAIGHDLLNDPNRRTEALATIASGDLILAGPFELVQGGTAVIGRLPVFLPDENDEDAFWGFVNVLINLSDLLAVGDLDQLSEGGYAYELSRSHPESEQPVVIARSGLSDLNDPVAISVEVPGGHWLLAVVPQDGWQRPPILETAFAILVALLVAALTSQILRNTMNLTVANTQLAAEVEEREKAQTALKEVNELLEHRVLDRTAALEGTIAQLEQEFTEREETEKEIIKLSKAVTASSEVIFMTDREGLFTYVNPAFEKLYGYAGDEIIGQKTPRILKGGQVSDAAYADFWRSLLSKQVVNMELVNRTQDGRMVTMSISANPILDNEEEIIGFLAIQRDITSQQQHKRELEAVIKVAETVRTAHTRAELAPVLLAQLESLLDASGVALVLVDAETGEAYAEMGLGVCAGWTSERLPPGAGVTGLVLESGRPYQHADVHSDPHIIRPDLIAGIQAAACVPLVAQEKKLGVLWLCRDTAVNKDELRLMAAIADIAANAIQRAMLFEESLQHAADLEKHVTERTQELAQANEQLQELDKLKSKFVSDVSHELRTPITNIKLYLDLLVHGSPENSERYIQILKQEADRLVRLVEATLELSRLDGVDDGLWQRDWLDLNQYAGQVVAAFQARASASGLGLHFQGDPDLPLVWAEPNQINQVLRNLVINALNYTPAGEVEVATAVANDNSFVCLSVRDTGMGISPADRQHLFDRFYRGQNTGQSAIPGTGLGLAIVKEIVDLHGGHIRVKNNEEKGTTFQVYLPLTKS